MSVGGQALLSLADLLPVDGFGFRCEGLTGDGAGFPCPFVVDACQVVQHPLEPPSEPRGFACERVLDAVGVALIGRDVTETVMTKGHGFAFWTGVNQDGGEVKGAPYFRSPLGSPPSLGVGHPGHVLKSGWASWSSRASLPRQAVASSRSAAQARSLTGCRAHSWTNSTRIWIQSVLGRNRGGWAEIRDYF